MIERAFIVPDVDNAGVRLARERTQIETQLLSIVGGFTAERVRGAWKGDNGRVYRDRSTRYVLAVDEQTDKEVRSWLPVWAVSLRQEALFTTRREAEVEFIQQGERTTVQ